mgnify:CR=1 FL=1
MSNLDDMRRLKEEIIASFDERMNTLSNIADSTSDLAQSAREMSARHRNDHLSMKNDLHSQLNNFRKKISNDNLNRLTATKHEFHERMSQLTDLLAAFRPDGNSELTQSVRETLESFRSIRLDEFNAFLEKLQQRIHDIKDDVRTTLDGFKATRREIADELEHNLSEFNNQLKNYRSALSQDEQKRYKQAQAEIHERIVYLDNLFGDVSNFLNDFRSDHQKMASMLKDMLAFKGFNNERLSNFKEMMDNILDHQKKRVHDTHQMIADFNAWHTEMKNELNELLANVKSNLREYNDQRLNLAHEGMSERVNYIYQMKNDISEILGNLRKESQKVAEEWKNIAKIMEQKRNISAPEQYPSASEKKIRFETSEQAPEPKKLKTEPSKKKPILQPENGNDLHDEILAVINQHASKGIKLAEIGKIVNKKWQSLIPFTKTLLEQGKIKKEDTVYFPN